MTQSFNHVLINWMGIFGPPDVEKLQNRRDIKGLVSALKYPKDPLIRKNAALALAGLASRGADAARTRAVPALIAALEDSDPAVISAAVQALGAIGQPAVLPLVSALRSPLDHTREGSARSIGRAGASISEPAYLRLVVDPLIALLRDPVLPVRRAAAWSLGRITPCLEPAQRRLPVESLVLALRDPSPEVREAAVASLGRSGEGIAIRPLVGALEDPAAAVSKIACEALDALGWKPASPIETASYCIARQDWAGVVACGEAAAPSLIRAIQGADQASRLFSIRALGRIASPDAIAPLVAMLKDSDEILRAAAASALEDAGAPQAIDPLLQAIRDRDRTVRKAVTRALGRTQDSRAVLPVIAVLRSRDKEMVDTAADALVLLGAASVPDLLPLLSEPDSSTQEMVGKVLVKIGSPAVLPLIALLRDAPFPTNRLAVQLLGEIRDPRAVWPLTNVLGSPDLAISAINALGQIGDSRAVRILLDQLNAYSEPVQRAAALALGSIGDPQALEPLLQLLRASDRQTRVEAANALLRMYRSGNLDLSQKRKILEQQDRFTERHNDVGSHQDEARNPDWHTDLSMHEDTGIGLDFPPSPPYT